MSTRTKAVATRDLAMPTVSFIRPANTTVYTIGDVLAEVTTNNLMTFGDMTTSTNSGMLHAVRCISSANQTTKPDLDLFLFSVMPVEVADNGPAAYTDAEMLTCVGVIPIPVAGFHAGAIAAGAGGNVICDVRNIDLPYQCNGHEVFGQLVARNGYTPVSGETFTVQLLVSRD